MNTVINALKKMKRRAGSMIGHQNSWEELEYFDEVWKNRIEAMAKFIAPGESVIDLGCGQMWLRPLLKDSAYYPVDYRQRDPSVFVADFNNYEFPDAEADVAFVSGAMEYVEDYQWFVRAISTHAKKCILSYCTTEHFPDQRLRRGKAWRSHLSQAELSEVFFTNGMYLEANSTAVPQNPIFVFAKKGKPEQDKTVGGGTPDLAP